VGKSNGSTWKILAKILGKRKKSPLCPAGSSTNKHFLRFQSCMWEKVMVLHGKFWLRYWENEKKRPLCPAKRSTNRHFLRFQSCMWEKVMVLDGNFWLKYWENEKKVLSAPLKEARTSTI